MHLTQGSFEVGLMGETGGKIAADDEVVDVGEEIVDAGVEFVEVSDDRDVGGTGPGSSEGGGFGVVAVHVEGSGIDDPFPVEIGWPEGKGFVTAPEDGALAVVIDEDKGLLAGTVGCSEDSSVHAGSGEGFAMEIGRVIVAK